MGKSKTSSHSNSITLKRKAAQLEASLSSARGEGLSAEQLKSEHDFLEYIKLLKKFAQRYCVIIVARNTPYGPSFTQELTNALMQIGLEVNLYEKYRCAYAALMDSGKLVFEELKLNPLETIDENICLTNSSKIRLISGGFHAPQLGSKGLIKINEKEYSQNQRGLNIVVYDKVTQNVLDSITFDVFADEIFGYRFSDFSNQIAEFSKNHSEVSVIGYKVPEFPSNTLTSGEQFIREHNIVFGRDIILNNLDKDIFVLNHYYDKYGIAEVLSTPSSYHNVNGIRHFEDTHGKYVNTVGGHRITADQPANPKQTIYHVGGCCVFGIGTDDKRTIASYLQNLFNKNFPDRGVIVQNYGYFLAEQDRRKEERFTILNALPVKPGDIILCELDSDADIPCIDLSKIAMQPRSYEVFFDTVHFTPDGYRLIAEQLFKNLQAMIPLSGERDRTGKPVRSKNTTYGFDHHTSNELIEYKSILKNCYKEMFEVTIGSVVMNCNPFTLGHRYLIEKALEQCNYLIVFVVEEDKSVFPFEDRLALVDKGTKDLNNVVIIPSGRFVLSSLTFSEYFNKSEMQDRIVDTSLDVTVFAKEIAPCLHITKRFVGEEPFDSVTRQYNETMRRVLPEYGIEFIEIPRKEINGEIISASRVRALLEKQDFDKIKSLVPESTFRYLKA